MGIVLKKLSLALKALLTPEFGAKVEMPSLSLNGTLVTSTAAELNFVDGVTSNVQTQLAGKAASSHNHAGTDITSGIVAGTRLPVMSTTAQGAVPASTTATGSQVLADDGWKKINNLYSGFKTLTPGATITWDLAADSYNATVTLAVNGALVINNYADGMSGCLFVIQGTGSKTLTLPSGSRLLGSTTLTLTSAINSIDILTFICRGGTFYWSIGNNYLTVI